MTKRSEANGPRPARVPWRLSREAPVRGSRQPAGQTAVSTPLPTFGHTGAMESLRSDNHSHGLFALVVVAAAIYSWIAAGSPAVHRRPRRSWWRSRPSSCSPPAWRPSREPARFGGREPRLPAGSGWWSLTVGWELLAYFSTPRHDHPTLSVIADEIMSVHVGRALMFLLWLALGWLLVRSPRSAAVVTSRTLTFVGYGAILALIITLAPVATRRANWMTLPDALERAHQEEARTDPGGRRLDLARLAPLRPRQRRLQVARRQVDGKCARSTASSSTASSSTASSSTASSSTASRRQVARRRSRTTQPEPGACR